MSNAVREGVLALLAPAGLAGVWDGEVKVDEAEKVILADLPYAVVYVGAGDPNPNERLCAGPRPAVVPFTVGNVGESVEQVLWVVEQTRARLDGVTLATVGPKAGPLTLLDADVAPRADDTYTRPGGGRIFYLGDRYEISL
ncbi:hypothetical protein [Mumia sp. DW29H23]|uniref:hypothetical protein n=1 Tax=Mumia sp. DW29H23 TaxID=3421241 RepID=UPI003D684032